MCRRALEFAAYKKLKKPVLVFPIFPSIVHVNIILTIIELSGLSITEASLGWHCSN